MVTPINNAMIVAAIANNGVMMSPYIVDKIMDDDMTLLSSKIIEAGQPVLTPNMASLLEGYMIQTSESGTAKALANESIQIASKTGSAENSTGPAHAWYVGYAPVSNPQIALAIIVENVGSSSLNAVPIAKEIYGSYLKVDYSLD